MDQSVLLGAISTLFISLVRLLWARSEDWKALHDKRDAELTQTRKDAAEDARKSAEAIRGLTAITEQILDRVNELPRRRDDWQPSPPGAFRNRAGQ